MASEIHFDGEGLSGGDGFAQVKDSGLVGADEPFERPTGLHVAINGSRGSGVAFAILGAEAGLR